jgi:hypothetical protein
VRRRQRRIASLLFGAVSQCICNSATEREGGCTISISAKHDGHLEKPASLVQDIRQILDQVTVHAGCPVEERVRWRGPPRESSSDVESLQCDHVLAAET